jgi:hypothetical protein
LCVDNVGGWTMWEGEVKGRCEVCGKRVGGGCTMWVCENAKCGEIALGE